jgi:hypothetical protein
MTNDIVQKLWNLCDVLRDDGINYNDYFKTGWQDETIYTVFRGKISSNLYALF